MKKGNGYGKGTFIEAAVFLSPAFLSLGLRGTAETVSNCSVQILILFLGKRNFRRLKQKGANQITRTDGNRLNLTYKELESRGISQQRATRSIDELLAKGFIKIVHPGGLCENDRAVYALTEDYKTWRPGDPAIRVRKKDVRRGYQGRRLGATSAETMKNTKPAHVNGGHSHARQRGTPLKFTRTSTKDTL
jgi:hypothetical protein